MPRYNIFTISYTDVLLSLSNSYCGPTHICWDYNSEDDFDPGLQFEHRVGSELEYWTRVRRSIRRLVELAGPIDKL